MKIYRASRNRNRQEMPAGFTKTGHQRGVVSPFSQTPTSPLLYRPGGRGSAQKNPGRWVGGLLKFFGEEGTPTPFMRYPTPPDRNRRGGVPSPARRTLHAKHRFRNWKGGGVVPCFVRNRGGGGLFMKMEN